MVPAHRQIHTEGAEVSPAGLPQAPLSRVCVGEKLRLITSCAYHGATSSESPHIAVFTEPHVTLQSAKCFLKNRPGSERVLQNITWVEYGFDKNTKC